MVNPYNPTWKLAVLLQILPALQKIGEPQEGTPNPVPEDGEPFFGAVFGSNTPRTAQVATYKPHRCLPELYFEIWELFIGSVSRGYMKCKGLKGSLDS